MCLRRLRTQIAHPFLKKCHGRDSGCYNLGEGDGDCDPEFIPNGGCRVGLRCGKDNCQHFLRSPIWALSQRGNPLYVPEWDWEYSDDCCYRDPRHYNWDGDINLDG